MNRRAVWRSAGIDAVICGLNMTEALASLPAGLDREFARRLFRGAESAFLKALEASEDKGKTDGE